MSDHDKRAEALFQGGKLIASNCIADIGVCNAQIMLMVAVSLVIGRHAGHHGKEPEVDIAQALDTIKRGAKEMMKAMPADFHAKP